MAFFSTPEHIITKSRQQEAVFLNYEPYEEVKFKKVLVKQTIVL
jgi:hypothetical protein